MCPYKIVHSKQKIRATEFHNVSQKWKSVGCNSSVAASQIRSLVSSSVCHLPTGRVDLCLGNFKALIKVTLGAA